MTLRYPDMRMLGATLILGSWFVLPALGQDTPAPNRTTVASDSPEAARRKILESDRWQQARRALDEWFAVQQIYSADEVADIRKELAGRIENMSPSELEVMLKEMEQRLTVLTSPEAKDARQWLSQFLAVTRNPERSLGMKRPDVLNMSSSEIRQELQQLQQQRNARRQAQAAFDRQRALQVQAAQSRHATANQQRQRAQEQSSRAATHATHQSRYAPQRVMQPAPFLSPVYTVGPWGTPIRWHPLAGYY